MDGFYMFEHNVERFVRNSAGTMGWEYYNTWRSIHMLKGFPDCVMVRPPRLVIAEIKPERADLSAAQRKWLDLLRQCSQVEVHLWRPGDVCKILQTLK